MTGKELEKRKKVIALMDAEDEAYAENVKWHWSKLLDATAKELGLYRMLDWINNTECSLYRLTSYEI